jgi:pimeloyl-ACP methyl ester carboxylesterase
MRAGGKGQGAAACSHGGSTLPFVKVVLLHALPLDATMWRPFAEGLPHEVLAPELYGLGDTLEQWAAGVLRLAGDGPMVLVGNSVGGSCAIEVARLAPGAVRHLVLIGAKPGHRPEPAYCDAAVRVLEDQGTEGAWPLYWEPLFGPATAPAVMESARRIAHAQAVSDVIRGVRVFHGRTDRGQFLMEWPGPVTVVSGQHDIAPERNKALADSLQDGRYSLVPGAGHYVPLENPGALRTVVEEAITEELARR